MVTHGRRSEGETSEWSGQPVSVIWLQNTGLLEQYKPRRLMCTARLPVVDWTDAPADLNGLVHLAERRNVVSAPVLSHSKSSLPTIVCLLQCILTLEIVRVYSGVGIELQLASTYGLRSFYGGCPGSYYSNTDEKSCMGFLFVEAIKVQICAVQVNICSICLRSSLFWVVGQYILVSYP